MATPKQFKNEQLNDKNMGYVTTGSSNSVTNEEALALDIMIAQDEKKAILLMGVFTIENLDTLVAAADLKKLSCELWAKTDDANKTTTFPVKICEFSYDNNNPGKRIYNFPRDYDDVYTYLIVKIRAAKCTVTTPSTTLQLSFKDKNDPTDPKPLVSLPFTVIAEEAKPAIIAFDADQTVVQRNAPVTVSWQIKGSRYIVREGLAELKSGTDETGSYTIANIANGDHSYTLEVQMGTVSVTKTILVRALGESKLYSNANPTGMYAAYKIGNFCTGQDAAYLYSLMLKTENNKTQIDHIGYTNTNEGFSDNWHRITLSDTEKNKLKPFATAPLLHMKSAGELHGRLFFIGGSYVKPMESANAVAIVTLDAESESRVTVIDNLPWDSRMGHSCAIFPHGDQDKIWMMGGVNEWGGALNDIWVSGDGKVWDNIGLNGSVNPDKTNPVKMPWKVRCLNGIATELDATGNKTVLWMGGGFSEIGGTETSDIWKWDKNNWTLITPLTINNNSYLSSGLAFLGKDTVDSTGIFLLGGYQEQENKKKYFYRVTLKNGKYGSNQLDTSAGVDSFATTKDSKIVTAFFKGCLWYMVFTNEGDLGITYSDLFYWVPVATGRTLILT
jgi:hypothetical protein